MNGAALCVRRRFHVFSKTTVGVMVMADAVPDGFGKPPGIHADPSTLDELVLFALLYSPAFKPSHGQRASRRRPHASTRRAGCSHRT
jgi:hypothetical protein